METTLTKQPNWNGDEAERLRLEGEMEKAIRRLEKKVRRAYETAMDVFPQLVRQETKLVDFLRTEHFCVDKAALRLALYWKFRKEMFQERWLLPMTQSGNGALTMAEVEQLRRGYSVAFQRADQGWVVIHDHSRLKYFDDATHAKVCMYLGTIMTDPLTQSEGMTLVFVIKSGERPPEDFNRAAWPLISTALPFRIKQILIVQAYEEGREYLLQFLAYQTKRALEVQSNRLTEHLMGDSSRNLLALLENKGVHRQFVPRSLGGDYDYSRFADWIRMRLSVEDVMAAAPLKVNKLTPRLQDTPAAGEGAIIAAPKKKKKKKKPTGPNDEDAKKLNALYSRRAYHKRKLEVLGLEEQVKSLRDHQKKLEMEGIQLQRSLFLAHQVLLSSGETTTTTTITLPNDGTTTAMEKQMTADPPGIAHMNVEPWACPTDTTFAAAVNLY